MTIWEHTRAWTRSFLLLGPIATRPKAQRKSYDSPSFGGLSLPSLCSLPLLELHCALPPLTPIPIIEPTSFLFPCLFLPKHPTSSLSLFRPKSHKTSCNQSCIATQFSKFSDSLHRDHHRGK